MEINELVIEVQNKNEEAYKELLNSFHRMIYSIINEYELNYGDYQVSADDLYQEACIALYEACFAFKDTKEAKFSTFVYTVIKRRIQRCYKTYKGRYMNEAYSIDNIEVVDHYKEMESRYVYDNPVEYHRLNETREQILRSAERLSEEDRAILLMRMEDYSYAEISKKLNISRKRIDNRLSKLRRQYIRKKF